MRFANGAIRNRKRFTYEEVQGVLDGFARPPARSGVTVPRRAPRPCGRGAPRDSRHAPADARPRAAAAQEAVQARVARTGRCPKRCWSTTPTAASAGRTSPSTTSATRSSRSSCSPPTRRWPSTSPGTRCRSSAASTRPRTRRSWRRSPSSPTCSATPIKRAQDRFELQRVLDATADKPERAAVHFALLRSLKQATYSPVPGRALRPRQQGLLPLHLAHPPLPGPAGPPAARPVDQDRHRERERGGTGRARRPLLEDGAPRRDRRARAGEDRACSSTSAPGWARSSTR